MGFSVKLAPGVRIRASKRGIRTSLGPRAARIHVGAGRAGVSTGFGPVGLYSSLGGSRGHPARNTPGGGAAATKALLAQDAQHEFARLLEVHRVEFPASQRAVAEELPLPDTHAIRKQHTHDALKGVGFFHRAERATAREKAKAAADAEIDRTLAELGHKQQARQAELDEAWHKLLHNDPDITLEVLSQRLEADGVAAPVSVDGPEASLVVLVPDESALPSRMPGVTAAGNPSLRKTTRSEQRTWYTILVSGLVVRTLRLAFAAAPGLERARLVALRFEGSDAYGQPRLSCILAGLWARHSLEGVHWQEATAPTVLADTATETLANYTAAGLEPLNLSREPELAALVESVDITELLSQARGPGSPEK